MERKTQSVYVIVRIDLRAEMDECEADEVVSEMDYRFDHRDFGRQHESPGILIPQKHLPVKHQGPP